MSSGEVYFRTQDIWDGRCNLTFRDRSFETDIRSKVIRNVDASLSRLFFAAQFGTLSLYEVQ